MRTFSENIPLVHQESPSGEEALRDHLRYSTFERFNFCDQHIFVELYDIVLIMYELEI